MKKVLVDVEPRTDKPSRWVEATLIGVNEIRGKKNYVVEIEGQAYGYPESCVKEVK